MQEFFEKNNFTEYENANKAPEKFKKDWKISG